jgi:hypothetical protein
VRLTCELCGLESDAVRPGLACYADDGRFERIDRCTDHQACRDRLEADRDEWPLIDITEKWVPA